MNTTVRPIDAQNIEWSAAPDWAMWWAMDDDGEAFWYERQPFVRNGQRAWSSGLGRVQLAHRGNPFKSRWQDSLSGRGGGL
jgi:hypothetical protein